MSRATLAQLAELAEHRDRIARLAAAAPRLRDRAVRTAARIDRLFLSPAVARLLEETDDDDETGGAS